MIKLSAVFIKILSLLVAGIAASHSESGEVSLAAAYDSDSALNDAWARYVVWQHPNRTIMLQSRDEDWTPNLITVEPGIAPKENSPLAAVYREQDDDKGGREITISYLDDKNAIITVICNHQDGKYFDWSTTPTGDESSSGLAMARTNDTIRRFFIDTDSFVVQEVGGQVSRLGPKAMPKSQVAATVPIGTSDIHVFFLSANEALSSITFNGKVWVEEMPAIDSFASEPDISFAVAAWSDPSIIRVFHINEHKKPSEWTFENGSWANTTRSLAQLPITAVEAGSAVAASRSAEGSGRYLEYFFATDGGQINYLAKNSASDGLFLIKFASFEIEKAEKLSTEAIVGIVTGIVGTVFTIIGTFVGCKWCRSRRNKGPVKSASSPSYTSIPNSEQEGTGAAKAMPVVQGSPIQPVE